MPGFTGRESVEASAGTLTIAAAAVLNLTDIRIRRLVTLHEATDNTSTQRKWRKGLASSEGQFTVFHDQDVAPLAEGTIGTALFTAYTGRTYTIEVIIESYEVSWNIDGMCGVVYNWRQSGTGIAADYAAA